VYSKEGQWEFGRNMENAIPERERSEGGKRKNTSFLVPKGRKVTQDKKKGNRGHSPVWGEGKGPSEIRQGETKRRGKTSIRRQQKKKRAHLRPCRGGEAKKGGKKKSKSTVNRFRKGTEWASEGGDFKLTFPRRGRIVRKKKKKAMLTKVFRRGEEKSISQEKKERKTDSSPPDLKKKKKDPEKKKAGPIFEERLFFEKEEGGALK